MSHGRLAAQALQLALVLAALHVCHVGESFGFSRLMPLILGGFVAHALAPRAWRQRLFLGLSLAGIPLVLGWQAAAWLVGLGLGLVGVAHLPGPPIVARLTAVAAAGGLVWLWEHDGGGIVPALALPVLGSMFMFRLLIYLYERPHERRPVSVAQRLSYFFMLPNVSFLLFPVVDYKAYVRGWYAGDEAAIHQRGLQLLGRGLVHILCYRALYHYVVPAPAEVTDLASLALFMAGTYALYLRISGQFHIAIGVLGLFGYALPDTHHLYFMATGFSDLWRRINVYWRDFMVKLFFNPTWFRLRRFGHKPATLCAIAATFIGTWLLHSYQWYWLRGSFPLTVVDVVFWSAFAVLIAANSLWEMRGGKSARERPTVGSLRAAAGGVATFAAMSVLWSFVSSPTIEDWLHLVAAGRETDVPGVLAVAGSLVGLWLLYALIHRVVGRESRAPTQARAWPGLLVAGSTLVLVVVAGPVQRALPAEVTRVVEELRKDRLNERDQSLQERGYYEHILDMDHYLSQLWQVQLQEPPGWSQVGEVNEPDPDHPGTWRLKANLDLQFKRAPLTTNADHMRDKTYPRQPPPGTWRAALLGGSGTMGSGVADGHNYESLTEARLAEEPPSEAWSHYELLNFSVPGYDPLRRLEQLEVRVFEWQPNAVVLVSIGSRDTEKMVDHLVSSVRRGLRPPFAPAAALVDELDLTPDLPESELYRRLVPHGAQLLVQAYARFTQVCRDHGAVPVWLYMPLARGSADADAVARTAATAAEAGFVTLSMAGAFDGRATDELTIAPWDGHPNALAHRLLADRLYAELRRAGSQLGW